MADLAGRSLGQYQLVQIIRRGGMSTIYKAYQPSLDRHVAVKVLLHPHDAQFIVRFKREARAVAQLQHPNILTIYDYGEEDGLLFLVMQYIEDGRTLQDLLQKALDPLGALRIAVRVLEALEYAHGHGIIHRDLKPSNVLMLSPMWPMLSDFGIAKLVNDKEHLTMPGLLLGTPAYIAPEQAIGRAVDARTDLYSAGVVLFEMLSGSIPFDAPDPMTMLSKHAFEEPPSLLARNPALPAELEQILKRALAKDPAARFQSAAEMGNALEEIIQELEQSRLLSQQTNFYLAGVQALEKEHWRLAVRNFSRVSASDPHYSTAVALLQRARDALAMSAGGPEQPAAEPAAAVEPQKAADADASPATPEAQPPSPPVLPAEAQAPPPTQVRDPSTARRGDGADQAPVDISPPVAGESSPNSDPRAADAAPASTAGAVAPRKRRSVVVAAAFVAVVALVLGLSRMFELWPDQRVVAGPPVQAGAATAVQPAASSSPPAASVEAPTPAAQPLPPRGTLVYEDDFSEGTSKSRLAELMHDPTFSRGVHAPGIYHLLLTNPADTRWQLLPGFAAGNFTIELDVADNSDAFDGGVSQGLIFRARDEHHFYALLIDSRQGRYSVRQLNGQNQWSDLQAWQASPLIQRADGLNRLRVDAEDNRFSIYINDRFLYQFTNDVFAQGMFGLIVANEDALAPHIHFDNIKVWRSDPPQQEAQHPARRQTPSGEMVLIPAGEFILGSNEQRDAAPQMVMLPDFYIDRTEVTNEAYNRCVAEGGCTPQQSPASVSHPLYANQQEFANYPVLHVSWQQAQQFCAWAGKRLPSEAEWEKAASWDFERQEKLIWPWGNQFDSSRLNSLEAGIMDTVAVDHAPPEVNQTFGIAGNVWEWTNSLHKPYPYQADDGREDPQIVGNRVLRGGSWSQTQGKTQSTARVFAPMDYSDREIGFRCAANP